MSSTADKIRENALRVKGNNESRRSQPTQIEPVSEHQPSAAEHGPSSGGEDVLHDGSAQSPLVSTAPVADPPQTPPARPQRARKSQSSSATPIFAPRRDPVRRTVDLTPAAHSKLDDWQRKTAREIGVARVSGQEVLATLVDEFLDNPDLAAVVRDSIWRRRQ